MKKLILALFVAMVAVAAHAVDFKVETVKYIDRDSALYMDVYMPQDTVKKHVCIIYLFGGGFKGGERNLPHIVGVMQEMASRGYVCAAIDYRLGLKNFKMTSVKKALYSLQNAINLATEDLMDATAYLYNNAEKYKIDPELIVSSGSSAGAITSLQADYYLHSDNHMAHVLPDGFKYAGIMSFSGAAASFRGGVKYTSQPAPTLFVHGTKDKLVTYNKIVIFDKGMYGSNYLAKQFKKNNWPYEIMRYKNFGHEVSWLGFKENVPEMCMFIERYVLKKGYQAKYKEDLDVTVRENDIKKPIWDIKGLNLYKKDVDFEMTTDSVQLKRFYSND